jgi:hypothetical protein
MTAIVASAMGKPSSTTGGSVVIVVILAAIVVAVGFVLAVRQIRRTRARVDES